MQKHQFFGAPSSLLSSSHIHTWLLEKPVLTIRTFVGKVMSLLFNALFTLVIVFLPSSKFLLISWLQSPSAMILKPKKIKSVTVSTFPPSNHHEVTGLMPWFYFLECWVLSQLFYSPLSPSSRAFLVPLHFLPLEWYPNYMFSKYSMPSLSSHLLKMCLNTYKSICLILISFFRL